MKGGFWARWWGPAIRRLPDAQEHEHLATLDRKLGAGFHDFHLLKQALIHRSFLHENPKSELLDNERLELLGDAVLDLFITEALFRNFPMETEGGISKLRSALVSEKTLSDLAGQYGLGDYLYLGKGEKQSGGAKKSSLLANTYEAILGALFLDRGFIHVAKVGLSHFHPWLQQAHAGQLTSDYKTKLQEMVQSRFRENPTYLLVGESGPDHDKVFAVQIKTKSNLFAVGKGRSKKEAEQEAARLALAALAGENR